jgi:hypothetical protein
MFEILSFANGFYIVTRKMDIASFLVLFYRSQLQDSGTPIYPIFTFQNNTYSFFIVYLQLKNRLNGTFNL